MDFIRDCLVSLFAIEEMGPFCAKCSQGVLDNDEIIKCESCTRVYHTSCVQVTVNDLNFLKDSKLGWKCSSCLQGGRKLRSGSVSSAVPVLASTQASTQTSNDLSSTSLLNMILSEIKEVKNMQQSIVLDINAIKESQTKMREEFNARCSALENSLSNCDLLLTEHSRNISCHNDRFSEVEQNIEGIKANFATAMSTLETLKSGMGSGSTVDDVLLELSEREARKNNLILFNMPESTMEDVEGRKRADEQSVRQLFSDITKTDISRAFVKVVRIGGRSGNKIRPLKIVLQSETLVADILRGTPQLRGLPQYHGIAVSSDRTPGQRQQYRLLKQQLAERVASGERNLKIRNITGIPRIVREN